MKNIRKEPLESNLPIAIDKSSANLAHNIECLKSNDLLRAAIEKTGNDASKVIDTLDLWYQENRILRRQRNKKAYELICKHLENKDTDKVRTILEDEVQFHKDVLGVFESAVTKVFSDYEYGSLIMGRNQTADVVETLKEWIEGQNEAIKKTQNLIDELKAKRGK